MVGKCNACNDNREYIDEALCPICGNPLFAVMPRTDHKKFRSIIINPVVQGPAASDSNLAACPTGEVVAVQNGNGQPVPGAVHANPSVAKSDHLVEGIVRNFKEEVMPGFLIVRWFRTLFMGVPFVFDKTINSFELYSNWGVGKNNSCNCDGVVIYGRVSRGKPNQDNTIRVWGRREANGTIVASKGFNVNSNSWMVVNHSINQFFAWLITLFIGALIYLLAINAGGIADAVRVFLGKLLVIVGVVLIAIYLIKRKLRRIFR